VVPLAVQQAQAYPETATHKFVSLTDFEDIPAGAVRQVEQFSFSQDHASCSRRLVVNNTRTGSGAMEVVLPAKVQLIYQIPDIHDFSGYTLLSMSVYCPQVRDDLRVTIQTDASGWTSPPTLLQSGWNTVLLDIRRLAKLSDFDIHGVRQLRLEFVDAAEPVTFNLDDIMLIDNMRTLPAPAGLQLRKEALDYRLKLPGHDRPLVLTQAEDGLWRWGDDQPLLCLARAGEELSDSPLERLAAMGARRVGSVEVLESNALRVRLANTWYFPSRAGQWISLAVRRIRWEHTIYADGRVITFLEFNNSGGEEIKAMRISLREPMAVAGKEMVQELVLPKLSEDIGRWNYLSVGGVDGRLTLQRNYLSPPRLKMTLAAPALAAGDLDRDGFDESQGCYYLKAKAGHCRFTLTPAVEGVQDPVFRVQGSWKEPPSVTCDGVAIKDVLRLDDGSVLFTIKGRLTRSASVEVEGPVATYEE